MKVELENVSPHVDVTPSTRETTSHSAGVVGTAQGVFTPGLFGGVSEPRAVVSRWFTSAYVSSAIRLDAGQNRQAEIDGGRQL